MTGVCLYFVLFHFPSYFRVDVDVDVFVLELKKKPTAAEKKKPHIKKPLNAFMLYMKEMRAKVVAECTLKESAAINQILGRRVSSRSNYI